MEACQIAVVVATRNEVALGAALRSVREQTKLPLATYLMNDETIGHRARQALRAATGNPRFAHVDIGLQYFHNDGEKGNPGGLRALALAEILKRGDIDVVAFLDADDTLAPHHLESVAAAHGAAQGNVDVWSPASLTYVYPQRVHDPRALPIPQCPACKSEVTDELVGAWVEYTRHGAAFAITTEALRRFGVGSSSAAEDEWVRWLPTLALQGAVFGSTGATDSYRYTQAAEDEEKKRRRAEHAATRQRTVRELFRKGLTRP